MPTYKIVSLRRRTYPNLDQLSAFQRLLSIDPKSIQLSLELSPERIRQYRIDNGPISFSYGTSLVNDQVLDLMQNLSDESHLIRRYSHMLFGDKMNLSENRAVLHHRTRYPLFMGTSTGIYGEERKKITQFADSVQSGSIVSATGKPFTDVVQIGIGGSDLGPRMLYHSLKNYVKEKKGVLPLRAHFISNVDPDDANEVLSQVNPETTLFIVVSKSGTTQETLTNLAFVQEKLKAKGIAEADLNKHFVAVTGKGSPMDDPSKYVASFYIDDNIGGRYSATSAVGGTVLSLAFGPQVFEEILQGAYEIDRASQNPDIRQNTALMDALIGVWERNVLHYPVKGVIPYSKALELFPKHLQQLDCESNGKSVNQYSEPVPYQTGPFIFGVPGTDGQHSFFQKIHQGSDVIPIEFIGVKKPQISGDLTVKGSTSQDKLKANLAAQIKALAVGRPHRDLNESFDGNRSTSLLTVDQVNPYSLGALLAHFENKVMFQGFLWNLNSFDQPGVQLGKVLTDQLLAKDLAKDVVKEVPKDDLKNGGSEVSKDAALVISDSKTPAVVSTLPKAVPTIPPVSIVRDPALLAIRELLG